MDVRALQEPPRAPRTAAYLEGLLGAFDADPLPGESFAFLLASDEDDPTARFDRLEVVGRRLLPPTRLLRSAALTVDPFLLRGASLGAAWRAERGGAAGAVYHTAGGGLPIASRCRPWRRLLDLAPWELPEAFQRGAAVALRPAAACPPPARRRGRARRRATRWRASARRLLRLRRDRIRVVPLAPRPAYAVGPAALAERAADARAIAERLGLGERYLVYPGRHDIRQDAATMLAALAALGRGGPSRRPGSDRAVAAARARARRDARRPRVAGPGRGAPRRGRPPRLRTAAARRGRRGRGRRLAGRRPADDLRCERPRRARCARRRRAGHRVGGRRAAGDRRDGRHPRRAARPRAAGGRARARHGATTPVRAGTRRGRARAADRPGCGPGPTSRPTSGRSTPRSADAADAGRQGTLVAALLERRHVLGGTLPSLIVIFDPRGMTWTKVWPTVSVHRLAVRVVEARRVGHRPLAPRALDGLAVGRRSRPCRAR